MCAFAKLLAKLLHGNGVPLLDNTVVTLDAEMQSCDVRLNKHCTCSQAIAKIEDRLRGERPDIGRTDEERFHCRRNSAV